MEASDSPTPVLSCWPCDSRDVQHVFFRSGLRPRRRPLRRTEPLARSTSGRPAMAPIYRGTLLNPNVTEFIPGGPGKEAVGMKVASGKRTVAGGFSGTVSVYENLTTRRSSRRSEASAAGMLNDLMVRRMAMSSSPTPLPPNPVAHHGKAQVAAHGGTLEAFRSARRSTTSPIPTRWTSMASSRCGECRSLVVVQSNTATVPIDLDEARPARNPSYRGGPPQRRTTACSSTAATSWSSNRRGDLRPAQLQADRGRGIERQQRSFGCANHRRSRERNWVPIVNADFSSSLRHITVTGLRRCHEEDDE